MRTAQRIAFSDQTATNVADMGGERSRLQTQFRVYNNGPAHVAGLVWTADFWANPQTTLARFQSFGNDAGGGFENWLAVVEVPGLDVSFEYVIFCDDYRGVQEVPRIYDTNGGETYRIQASFG